MLWKVDATALVYSWLCTYSFEGFSDDLALRLPKCLSSAAIWRSFRRAQLGRMNQNKIGSCVRGERPIMNLFRRLGEPVCESQLAVALSVAAVTMALMLCAILWQSS